MQEKDNKAPIQPGLPEALHPEIGNGTLWEADPHLINLRSVDPLLSIDQHLLDENDKSSLINEWDSDGRPLTEPAKAAMDVKAEASQVQGEPPEGHAKKRGKKLKASPKNKSVMPEWLAGAEDDLVLKEDPNNQERVENTEVEEELPALPEGKRVRKAVRKAEKALKAKRQEPVKENLKPKEADLSPYTKWLKSLKGSEYVHPFDDDYALDQRVSSPKDGISETFADLLASQGFKDQAIDMYMLLMAKYPEKSSFFAAKIESLK